MNARWRKSSRSSHAGDNCVEIALRVVRHAKGPSVDPRRGYVVTRKGAGWWYVSSRV